MHIKRLCLGLFFSFFILNGALSQRENISFNIGLNQSLFDEIRPGLEFSICGRLQLKFLKLEYGISLLNHLDLSTSTQNYDPLLEIEGVMAKTEEYSLINRLRYGALPIGVVLSTQKNIDFGLGLQPMILVSGTRTRKLDYFDTEGKLIYSNQTEISGQYPNFNLEFYAYLKIPVWKRLSLMVKISDGLVTLRPDFPGNRLQSGFKTKRISMGIGYSI